MEKITNLESRIPIEKIPRFDGTDNIVYTIDREPFALLNIEPGIYDLGSRVRVVTAQGRWRIVRVIDIQGKTCYVRREDG